MSDMKRIASFDVNHDVLNPGMYISRVDGDVVTYDIRFIKPNTPPYISVEAAHTIEHIFATYARNSRFADSVVYFGPMGCMTGFYLLLRDSVSYEDAILLVREALQFVADFGGDSCDASLIPGVSRIECGNYLSHNLTQARALASDMVKVLAGWNVGMLKYRGLTLIQGAMFVEIEKFLEKRDFKEVCINDFKFYVSDDLVISLTGIGMTNATIATVIAINEFHPTCIINQGTAGGHTEYLHVGDFVVADKSVNININFGSDDDSIPLDNQFKYFDADASLVKKMAEGAAKPDNTGLFTGTIGSGDVFNKDAETINKINAMYGELAEDMETAAVFEVCKHFNVPCAGIRVISNNELTKEAYVRETAHKLQHYVYQCVVD